MAGDTASRWRIDGWRVVLATALISATVAAILGQRFEERVGDIFLSAFQVFDRPPDDIVIIAITEDTLAHLPYRSPVDRGFLADLITRLDAAKPKVIGIDVLIDQPSEPAKDRRLHEAVSGSATPVIMGAATVSDGLTGKQAAFLKQALTGLDTGFVTLLRDRSDGTVRYVLTRRELGGAHHLSLAAAMARRVMPEVGLPAGRITYYSREDWSPVPFKVYPAHTVPVLPPDWIAGKYVFIGSMLPNADLHRTPFMATVGADKGLVFGVSIHAHMLAQILAGDRLMQPSRLAAFGFTIAFGLVGALIFLSVGAPALRLAGLTVLVAALWIAGAASFTFLHVHIPLTAPSLAALLLGASLSLGQWFRDRAQRDFIERAFSQYVSPALVKRIVASQKALSLGGEKRVVTYVFTDLENFTALAERLDPAEMAALLNDYLDHMCELFIGAEATIDKIIGDAVVGFFGAPEPQPDQTERAVGLALSIDRFSQDYRQKAKARGIDLGVTRVGVHRGEAVVGNFGGTRFFDYTSIGDTVNTAARLEAANRMIGTRICVSDAVVEHCPGQDFRPIGTLILKGKTRGVACFEPLADGPDAAYDAAYALLDAGDAGAAGALTRLAGRGSGDRLAQFHLNRLQRGDSGTTIVQTEK